MLNHFVLEDHKKFQSKNTAQMRMIKAVPARRTCACVLAC